MDYSLWGNGRNNKNNQKRYLETVRQKRSLISSSSSENSEDEEWIQQLERDYGRHSLKKKIKWTRLEKTLTFALLTSLFLIVFLLAALIYSKYRHGDESLLQFTLGGQKYCNTESCVKASHRVFTYADKALNPCDSFYDYACGSWIRDFDLPTTHSKWTSYTEVSDRNQHLLKQILHDIQNKTQTSEALEKVRRFYKSCLKSDYIEKNANKSLERLIEYVGSWALTSRSTWNEEKWSFGDALTRIHHLKSMPLFYMYVAADDRNSTQNIIQIEQSGITLGDESFYNRPKNDKLVKGYLKMMMSTALLLGGSQDSVVKQSLEVFEFEKKLASIYERKDHLKKTEKIYNKITVGELLVLCPAIPWLDYMNSMFSVPVRADESVIVYTPTYLKQMSNLVIKTERRIIANYMVWHLIKPTLPLLSKPFRMTAMELSSKENGLFGLEESWKNCVTKTDSVLGFGTGNLFVTAMKKRGKYNEKKVKRMLDVIKEEFLFSLRHNEWMDDVTTKKAIEKATSIIEMVGYPSWILSTLRLDDYYKDLNVTDDPLQNFFNAREFYHSKTMDRRGKPVRKNEWHMTPTEVNAYYNAPNNYIALPMGILQSPFFNHEFPQPLNYGALGTIMAHELTHGFDSQGRYFDKNGNLKNWWSNVTITRFKNKTKCLGEHYKSFDPTRETDKTLAEDFADQGGLKVAYGAFRTANYVDGDDRRLPGIDFSPEKLFFLGYAQTWCSLSNSERSKQSKIMDKHSDVRTRVDASLANNKQFADAFGCSLTTRMNPPNKCLVW